MDISVFWSFWFYFVLILLVLSFFCYFLLFLRSFVIPHILYIFVFSIFLPEIPLVYRIPGTVLVSCSFSLWKFFQSNFVTENWRTLLFSESIPLNKSKGLQHVQFLYRSHSPRYICLSLFWIFVINNCCWFPAYLQYHPDILFLWNASLHNPYTALYNWKYALSLQLTDTFCKFLYGMIPIGKNLHYIFTFWPFINVIPAHAISRIWH